MIDDDADEVREAAQAHRAQAITANNSTWELLDGRSHSPVEADDLLQRAYAAAYHWQRAADATPVNWARASWLISRAHAVLGHGDLALHHGDQLAVFVEQAGEQAADFDRAFCHEARARALACVGRSGDARAEYDRALAVEVEDEEDREIVASELAAEPWYGLDRA